MITITAQVLLTPENYETTMRAYENLMCLL